MSVILLDEKVIHYEVLGRGRPVIFLHGWVGSWRYWVPAMQTAAMSFRAYALDLWGFGDSAKEGDKYSIKKQADLLDRFLQELGIGRVALIGHGLGGLAGLSFASKYPAIVDRLMLVNVPFESGAVTSRLRHPSSPTDLADWLLGKDSLSEPVRVDAPKTDPQAIEASFQSLDAYSFLPVINSLTIPCLIVHGQNDPAVQPQYLEQVMALPECVHQVLFDISGHFPMLDEGPTFNHLMTDFLALQSGDSPRQLQLKEEWKRRVR